MRVREAVDRKAGGEDRVQEKTLFLFKDDAGPIAPHLLFRLLKLGRRPTENCSNLDRRDSKLAGRCHGSIDLIMIQKSWSPGKRQLCDNHVAAGDLQ